MHIRRLRSIGRGSRFVPRDFSARNSRRAQFSRVAQFCGVTGGATQQSRIMLHLDHPRDRHYPEDREREKRLARLWQGRELARRRDNDSPTDGD